VSIPWNGANIAFAPSLSDLFSLSSLSPEEQIWEMILFHYSMKFIINNDRKDY